MTDDELLAQWEQAAAPLHTIGEQVIAFGRALLAAEREACAKVCERTTHEAIPTVHGTFYATVGRPLMATECAAAIRAKQS